MQVEKKAHLFRSPPSLSQREGNKAEIDSLLSLLSEIILFIGEAGRLVGGPTTPSLALPPSLDRSADTPNFLLSVRLKEGGDGDEQVG